MTNKANRKTLAELLQYNQEWASNMVRENPNFFGKLAKLQASVQLYIAMGGGWNQKQSDTDFVKQLDWFPL